MKVGDRIRIKRGKNEYEGTLMPGDGEGQDRYIAIKLDNGYNVGFLKNKVEVKLVKRGKEISATMPETKIKRKKELPDIAIIGTGGTVASKIDYKTGAVYPAFSPEELLQLVPELGNIANIYGKEVLSIVSEDICFDDWKKIAKSIASHLEEGYDGVVVTHGTDVLHYTASMMSFMLRNLYKPVVFVGSQRSSDRPSSDAAFNLISSVNFSGSDCKEVVVCMHASLSDDYCYIHRGTKVRKFHTSRRDAFVSVNALPVAKVYGGGKIEFLSTYKNKNEGDFYLDTKLEEKVALIKTYPGARDIVSSVIDREYRGIILEGTGLGHAPASLCEEIKRGIDEGIIFGMTSQCINGRVNLNVYRGGRKLKNMGVIPLGDMLPETAWCKLCWVLGHYGNYDEVRKKMLENIVGELSNASRIDSFNFGRW
ncbi:MAG: Glu-tRNA(Gln) amidotransferase subunit GatD [Candidatus Methanofastidiosia archaeon]